MAEDIESLKEAIKSLSNDNKKNASDNEHSFREESSQNDKNMYSIVKDLGSYFASNKQSEEKLATEIEEQINETENVARKVDNSNELLQNSINIQNQMLSEMGSINTTLEKLFASFPEWISKSGGHGSSSVDGFVAAAEAAAGIGAYKGLKNKVLSKGTEALTVNEEAATSGTKPINDNFPKASNDNVKLPGSVTSESGIKSSSISALDTAEKTAVTRGGWLSSLGRGAATVGKALPFVGDAIQGGARWYESGSFGEGLSAAGGSFAGRLAGGAVGSVAGPVGTFAGEVGGSIYGANKAADAYHTTFNKDMPIDKKATEAAMAVKDSSITSLKDNEVTTAKTATSTSLTNNESNSLKSSNPSSFGGEGLQVMTSQGIKPLTSVGGRGTLLGGVLSNSNIQNFVREHISNPENVDTSEAHVSTTKGSGRTSDSDYSSTKASKATGNLAKNQQDAYNAAKANGLDDESAKLLVANMSGESLKDPSNIHWDKSHTSQGIVQWDPTRSERIKKEFGKEPKDMTVAEQTKAAIWEMKKYYPDAYSDLNNNKLSKTQRLHSVVKNYERPTDVEGATRQRMGYRNGLNVKEANDADKVNMVEQKDGESQQDLLGRVRQNNPNLSPAECVDLVKKYTNTEGTRTSDWRRGEKESLKRGEPVATFMKRDGSQSEKYDGGLGGVRGNNTTHAAIFDQYNTDSKGNRTGIRVLEQDSRHGPHFHDYNYGDKKGGEKDAGNYYSVNDSHGNPLGGKPRHEAPTARPESEMAHRQSLSINDDRNQSAGGAYGGGNHNHPTHPSGGASKDIALGPSWGDMVRSVTGSYGMA